MNRRRKSAALAALALAGALVAGCGRRAAAGATPPAVDAKALEGRVAAAHGHPLLVVFWATWCGPCVEEMPDLVALDKESPGGLRVLAVSLDTFLSGDSTNEVVTSYLQAHPAPVEHVIYSGSQDALFSRFDLPGNIPYSILYDASGAVLKRFGGRTLPADVRAALSGAQS